MQFFLYLKKTKRKNFPCYIWSVCNRSVWLKSVWDSHKATGPFLSSWSSSEILFGDSSSRAGWNWWDFSVHYSVHKFLPENKIIQSCLISNHSLPTQSFYHCITQTWFKIGNSQWKAALASLLFFFPFYSWSCLLLISCYWLGTRPLGWTDREKRKLVWREVLIFLAEFSFCRMWVYVGDEYCKLPLFHMRQLCGLLTYSPSLPLLGLPDEIIQQKRHLIQPAP